MSDPTPRRWCEPNDAFGDLSAQMRVWLPPPGNDPVVHAEFLAAVLQNAISLHIRMFKNKSEPPMGQEALGKRDGRPYATRSWNARLRGRKRMSLDDVGVVVQQLPGALPHQDDLQVFVRVALGEIEPPPGWRWPDTSAQPVGKTATAR